MRTENKFETRMKELMDFSKDIAEGLYYMGQTEICGSFPVDGKTVELSIKLKVTDESES